MKLLPDNVLYTLLQKLSSANMPAELLRMLNAMHVDGRRMPAADKSITDNAASSLLTSWLAGARSTASQSFEGAACCSDMQACLFSQWPWLLCIMQVWLTNMQACLINVDKCMAHLNAGLSGCQGKLLRWCMVLGADKTADDKVCSSRSCTGSLAWG